MKITVVPAAASERMMPNAPRSPRGEHRCRLVEDEDPRFAVEGLEDLDALPDADRQVLDRRVGFVELVLLGRLDDPLSRRGG
jgi:hypothetical protein